MNHVNEIGRLCNDPKIQKTKNGDEMAKYTLAVPRSFNKDKESNTDFLDCFVFGKGVGFVKDNLRKGVKIAIEGAMRSYGWEDETGKYNKITYIQVSKHEFCEQKKDPEGFENTQEAPQGTDNKDLQNLFDGEPSDEDPA